MGSTPEAPLDGKICVVTGATSGIGLATARGLARLGGTVVLAGRDERRCARAAARLRGEIPAARLETVVADLSSQAEVRRMCLEVARRHPRVDVLVQNAGARFVDRRLSADGVEMTFALNHLAVFASTLLLLPRLRAGPAARVVVVSSDAHEGWTLDLDDLQGERGYERMRAYCRSKLANLLFTFALARRLSGSTVTVNALHPGTVATNLGSEAGWLRVRLRNLLKRSLLAPEQGARTSLYLATSPEVAGVSGRYFDDRAEVPSSPASRDEALAEGLWRRSEELTGLRWEDLAAAGTAAPLPRSWRCGAEGR